MIYPGTKYRNNEEMKVSGTIHFRTAYSAGFDFVLPKGETFKISYFTDPDDKHIQVWLDNSPKFENQVAGEYLNSEKYDSYSLTLTKGQIESFCESLVDFSDALYFYSSKEKYGQFSNFADFGFEYQEKFYSTVEHFYQSQKFSDTEYSEKIRLSATPKLASELGKSRNHKLKENWDEIKNDLMFLGVKLKFENNKEILESLIGTDDRLLIENSPYDKYWGIGQDGTGYNHLGTILMRVREILKTPHNNG
jgi:ribA/ribD-fused uncharacterized protein